MKDRGNQLTLGVFLATFVYCLLVLRSVRSAADRGDVASEFVPHLALTVAIVLALGSVFVLIYFIHHAPQTLNVSNVVARLGREIGERIKELFPELNAREDVDKAAAARVEGGHGTAACASGERRIVRAGVGNCYLRVLDLEGLYDVVFKAAHVGASDTGFETALVATSIGLDNARKLAERYLAEIRWTE